MVSNIFYFSTLFGEMIQFDQYFSKGLKPPTRTGVFFSKLRPLADSNNSEAICGLSRSNFSVSMLEKVLLESAMALRSFSCVGLEKGEKIPLEFWLVFSGKKMKKYIYIYISQ